MRTDRYGRLRPYTKGESGWTRSQGMKRHYRHESGVGVVYLPNHFLWEVIGGPDDGHRYSTLSVAQHAATR